MPIQSPINQLIPQPTYVPVVEDLIACLKSGLKDNLHSVYIYGSVANGNAIPNVSNLDVVLVTQRPLAAGQKSLFNSINWRFQKDFPFVKGLAVRTALVSEVASLSALFTWGFLLKQCCTNVYGEDLAECFGHYVPSWEIAKQWNMDIEQSAAILRREVALAEDAQSQLSAQRQLAKKLLRAAYGLVLHKTKRWLDDPLESGRAFLDYYPERQQTIERLGILLGQRVIPKRSVVGLLDDFAPWLAKEYQKTEFKIG
ncbi:nucleotidyltransferase domain-containing protein [Vibrio maritimus]|uniref:nucleotidyltransferase domain-containing protein n=1 Tax=Vibrio maritimus TaxID=990268 RepID=UPI003734C532